MFCRELHTTTHNSAVSCAGIMVNTNTFETFKQTNPEKFINTLGKNLITSMKDGSALHEPWKLLTFLLLCYSDLKKHRFYFWAAHPTPFNLPEMHFVTQQIFISQKFSKEQIHSFEDEFKKLSSKSKSYFSVHIDKESNKLHIISLAEAVSIENSSDKEV